MQHMHHNAQENNAGKRSNQYDLFNDLEKLKAVIAETTGDAKGKAQEVILQSLDNIQKKYASFQRNATAYVEENPFKAVAASLVTGIIIGLLLRK